MPNADEPRRFDNNPMLSEIPLTIRRILNWDFVVVGVAFLWAFVVVLIAIRCGAAWVALTFSGELKPGVIEPNPNGVKYGYLVELNHGFFYLILAPIFLWFGSKLVREIDATVRHLVIETRLQLVNPDRSLASQRATLNWIADRNRQICGPMLIVLILAVPFLMIVPELGHLNETNFGWVQSINLPKLDAKRVVTLSDFKERLAGAEQTYKNYDRVEITKISFAKGKESVERTWFWWLFWLALIMENCFVTIAVWVGIKILFLLGLLSVAYFGSSHPERRNKPFPKLDLKFLDKDYYRFGLASLDKLYRGAIWLVLIALVAFYLQQISNVSKGPLIVAGPEHGVSYPQVATLIAPTFVMLAILIVPAAVYVRLLRRAKEREITRLAQEVADQRNRLRAAATDQEKEEAQDELQN
jgi:hypothetical protein